MTSRRILPRLLLAWAMWVGLESAALAQFDNAGPAHRDWVLSVVIFVVLMAGPLYLCCAPTGRSDWKGEDANPLTPKGAPH